MVISALLYDPVESIWCDLFDVVFACEPLDNIELFVDVMSADYDFWWLLICNLFYLFVSYDKAGKEEVLVYFV
jgi:hypothetical protein